jgi:hypothetical protein
MNTPLRYRVVWSSGVRTQPTTSWAELCRWLVMYRNAGLIGDVVGVSATRDERVWAIPRTKWAVDSLSVL